jgi:hypothetical protein
MKTSTTPQLINQLEDLATNSMLPLERRLVDTAVWFHKNKDRLPKEDVPRRLEFLEKSFDIFLELVALTLQRMQTVEGRKGSSLYLPRGITLNDTIR